MSYGTGAMTERAPGVWRLRVRTVDPRTGRSVQHSKTIHTAKRGGKLAAREALREFARQLREAPEERTSTLFRVVAEEWMAALATRGRSPATLDTYRAHLEHHIYPVFADTPVHEVTARALDAFYGSLALAPATVRITNATVMGVLRQAKRWGLLDALPEPTPPTPPRGEEREAVTPADVVTLITAAKEGNYDTIAALIYVAAMTGLRRGELCGLKVEDLDWDTATLRVRRQIRGSHGEGLPKDGSTRVVALGPTTVEVVQGYLAAERERWGIEPGPWLFSYDGGATPIHPPRVSEAIGRLAKAAGVKATTHGLRHFHSTYGVAGGVDLVTMAKRAGHTVEVATQVYMHRVDAQDRQAAVVLERALAGS